MISSKSCCGCMACFNICPTKAISIIEDEEGFNYPRIDEEKCIKCGLCDKVCDYNKEQEKSKNVDIVYAVNNKSDEIRKKSTSGGVFTALYTEVINNDGVVYGASLNENLDVKHIRCTKLEECEKCRGSKYVQSNTADVYEMVACDLKENKIVLFTGSACQTQAIKSYCSLKKIDSSNLITCDFICHGVPSKKIFKEHIKQLELKYNKKVIKYRFRTKEKGWVGHNEEATFEDGEIISSGKYLNIYKELYGSLCIIRPSCYKCPYANKNHEADITIGDFWGLENKKDSLHDNLGTSFVKINTKKGQELFDKISNQVVFVKEDINNCRNPQLHGPVQMPAKRSAFWKLYSNEGYLAVAKKYTTYGKINLCKKYIYKMMKVLGADKLLHRK